MQLLSSFRPKRAPREDVVVLAKLKHQHRGETVMDNVIVRSVSRTGIVVTVPAYVEVDMAQLCQAQFVFQVASADADRTGTEATTAGAPQTASEQEEGSVPRPHPAGLMERSEISAWALVGKRQPRRLQLKAQLVRMVGRDELGPQLAFSVDIAEDDRDLMYQLAHLQSEG